MGRHALLSVLRKNGNRAYHGDVVKPLHAGTSDNFAVEFGDMEGVLISTQKGIDRAAEIIHLEVARRDDRGHGG
ncbi:protein of unknown function [Cupriavidus taiwanensis]|uniref:Uncharacterized protein n=1 Tax=Cupriavidus taiwanensis TaxID=164546 RepID=A0A375IEE4_9BURK|nr:protein of unknown function [Cupriavidus taiwanensis]